MKYIIVIGDKYLAKPKTGKWNSNMCGLTENKKEALTGDFLYMMDVARQCTQSVVVSKLES